MVREKKRDTGRDEESDLITISEAAALRGASVSAISHLVRRGRLRSVGRYGKTLVYRSDVEAFEAAKPGPKADKSAIIQMGSRQDLPDKKGGKK